MLFAPQDGQVVDRTFNPPTPTAATLGVWPRARDLAETCWQRLADDDRLSLDFRGRSTRALEAVRALPVRGSIRARVAQG